MTFSTPKRKSGLPSPATGILSSNRKSKLQTPQSRKFSRLSSLSSTKKSGGIVQRSSSGECVSSSSIHATPNATLEAAKRSLAESSFTSTLPIATKNVGDISDAQKSPTRSTSYKTASSSLLSSTTQLSTSPVDENEEAVKVCVRIRPLLSNDNADARAFVLGSTENTIVRNVETAASSDNTAPYSFNHVYGESSSTQQVYDDMVSDIVTSVGCQGRNGTVFTYGQTSTGKLHLPPKQRCFLFCS